MRACWRCTSPQPAKVAPRTAQGRAVPQNRLRLRWVAGRCTIEGLRHFNPAEAPSRANNGNGREAVDQPTWQRAPQRVSFQSGLYGCMDVCIEITAQAAGMSDDEHVTCRIAMRERNHHSGHRVFNQIESHPALAQGSTTL